MLWETRVRNSGPPYGSCSFCTALHLHVTGLANTDSKTRIDDTVRPDNIGTVKTKNSPRHVSRMYKQKREVREALERAHDKWRRKKLYNVDRRTVPYGRNVADVIYVRPHMRTSIVCKLYV